MQWLSDLLLRDEDSVAHAILILSLVAASGLALGSIRVRSIGLGIAGSLFAGLAFGHFGFKINPEVAEFVREFGLILFVYTIGLQVGPGFFASLKRQGLPLNAMAAAVVLLGVATTLGIYFLFMDRGQLPAAVGIFSGATTNTPSLAAAQQALEDMDIPAEARNLPGIGYAVAYPFGILGIILTMILIRKLFQINIPDETAVLARQHEGEHAKLETRNLEVKNPNLAGLPLKRVPALRESGVVISRVMQGNQPRVALPDTVLQIGDILHAVGSAEQLEQLRLIVGDNSAIDVKTVPSNITMRRLIVTKSEALGRSIQELDLRRFGVNVTRVNRADVELPSTPDLRLQFGDQLVVVGEEQALKQVAVEVGDSVKRLQTPQVMPVFVGIALGVLVGSIPIAVPGLPVAFKLGLAGGPLVIAILLSRVGHIGRLVWYMPSSANLVLRELGIVLFLSVVGLKSGGSFVQTLTHGPGLLWMLYGALITVLPLLIVGVFARWFLKLNYLSLCGLLSGSMTDPPALAFATQVTGSDAPHISYATVYPLVMLLRVIAAQLMLLAY